MALSLLERGQLTRLKGCIAPVENRIAFKKKKLQEITVKFMSEISEMEAQIKGFKDMIAPLEAKSEGTVVNPIEATTTEE